MKKFLLIVALVICVLIGGRVFTLFRSMTGDEPTPPGGDSSTEEPAEPATGVQLDDTSIIF